MLYSMNQQDIKALLDIPVLKEFKKDGGWYRPPQPTKSQNHFTFTKRRCLKK